VNLLDKKVLWCPFEPTRLVVSFQNVCIFFGHQIYYCVI
jgi:hypothetical protein